MKHIFTLSFIVVFFTFVNGQNTRTTIADGLASNPFVWDCICIPLPGDSVVINHTITLNYDYAISKALLVNTTGKLIGDNPNRGLLLTGYFENRGYYNVARTAFYSGTARNSGSFLADSLFTALTVNGFLTSGYMEIGTSFWNTGIFKITDTTAQLVVRDNFYNGDSLITGINALLVNDGQMRINLDFANSDTIRGSGQICIDGNSLNIGIITGTLDFCDISSGSIDLNLGTITGGVQFCQATCSVGIDEEGAPAYLSLYPNPVSDLLTVETGMPSSLAVYDISGRQVFVSSTESVKHTLTVSGWQEGVYIYKVLSGAGITSGKFVKAGN